MSETSKIITSQVDIAAEPNPDVGFHILGIDTDGKFKRKNSAGIIFNLEGAAAVTLSGLEDISLGSPLVDGQVLTYDSISGKWINMVSGGGSSTLATLTDVNLGSLADGEVLTYDSGSGKWINGGVGVTGTGTVDTITQWTDTNVVGDGTWAFSGNDIYPVNVGSNIGLIGVNKVVNGTFTGGTVNWTITNGGSDGWTYTSNHVHFFGTINTTVNATLDQTLIGLINGITYSVSFTISNLVGTAGLLPVELGINGGAFFAQIGTITGNGTQTISFGAPFSSGSGPWIIRFGATSIAIPNSPPNWSFDLDNVEVRGDEHRIVNIYMASKLDYASNLTFLESGIERIKFNSGNIEMSPVTSATFATGVLTYNPGSNSAVAATGSINMNPGPPIDGDYILIDSFNEIYYFDSTNGGWTDNDFTVYHANIEDSINGYGPSVITATQSVGILHLTAKTPGAAGNLITIDVSNVFGAVWIPSGPNLTGGVDAANIPAVGNVVTIGARTYTFNGTNWIDLASNAHATLLSSINGDPSRVVNAIAGIGLYNLTAITIGAAGNSIVTTTSPSNFRLNFASGTSLGGGTDTVYPNIGTSAKRTGTFFLGSSLDYETNLLFKQNGTEKARITSTGNFGIGTINPVHKLTVAGGYQTAGLSGVADELHFGSKGSTPDGAQIVWGDNSGWKLHFGTRVAGAFTKRMTMMDTGNIGVNIGTPNALVDIAGSGAATDFKISRAGNTNAYFSIASVSNNNTTAVFVATGTGNNSNTVMGLQPNGGVQIGSYVNTAANPAPAGGMLIPGQVGIGTVSPAAGTKLHVIGSASYVSVIQSTATIETYISRFVNGNNEGLFVVHEGTSGGTFGAGNNVIVLSADFTGGNAYRNLSLATNGSSRILINTSGSVGIGHNSPTARLHTKGSGNTSATTNLELDNSSGTTLLSVLDDGTTTINGSVVVAGALATSQYAPVNLPGGTYNDYALGNTSFWFLGVSGPVTITGIVPTYVGQRLVINILGGSFSIAHQNAGSNINNRFHNRSGGTVTIAGGTVQEYIYTSFPNSTPGGWYQITS